MGKMGKEISNKSTYVFKNMLQILLNNVESVSQVAKCINGFLFYSIPQKGYVEIEFNNESKILRASQDTGIEKILEILERDKSCKISFYLGTTKVIQLQRYQVTRFEITVFEDKE